MSTKLESPGVRLKDSYLSLVEEFKQAGEPPVPFPLKFPTDDFPAFLEQLENCSRGLGIPDGFVAHETFWLVEDGTQVVGVSNLRYTLTDALRTIGGNIGYGIRPSARRRGHATTILRETLVKAQEHGLARVLVTANRGNMGSVKAILKNGGVLDSEELLPGHPDVLQRFWITVG